MSVDWDLKLISEGPTMGLYSIVYVSTAVRPLLEDDLINLLTVSRERNKREDITGILLYSNGRFIQYIEGPELLLKKLFADICIDHRHTSVTELVSEHIEQREFGSWTMGYIPLSGKDFDNLLASSWPIPTNHGWPGSGSNGKQLLQIIWEQMKVATANSATATGRVPR